MAGVLWMVQHVPSGTGADNSVGREARHEGGLGQEAARLEPLRSVTEPCWTTPTRSRSSSPAHRISGRWHDGKRPHAVPLNLIPLVRKALEALLRRVPVEYVKPHTPISRADFAQIGAPARTASREHVVRGHFRWYGEAGLFGKHPNMMVWVPEHHRGDDTLGTIAKDYDVGTTDDHR
ncbi:MAG: hypothetical protein EOM24_27070 [Chloroflexia bacterium]|nr:hypothetical protein [Chloroflexia bacterium]